MADEYIPSILTSTKRELGLPEDYTAFDPDIITHINSSLAILFQLGVGPQDKAFQIEDEEPTWEDFLGPDKPELNMTQSEVFIRVKSLFDPPSTTHVAQALKETQLELDWRLTVAADEEGS